MKKGFLLFLGIALTIVGVYLGWSNYSKESGGVITAPPALALLTGQDQTGQANSASGAKSGKDSIVITDQDRVQLSTLNSILASRNDNDERLDKDLKVLSEGAKELLRKRYDEIAPEARNERGTIVFLLGRNLTQDRDIDFLRKVMDEAPCRSLENCKQDVARTSGAALHEEIGIEVTLNYPQVMSLKMLEHVLERGESDPLYNHSLDEVEHATHSGSEKVVQVARDILAHYARGKGRK